MRKTFRRHIGSALNSSLVPIPFPTSTHGIHQCLMSTGGGGGGKTFGSIDARQTCDEEEEEKKGGKGRGGRAGGGGVQKLFLNSV